MNVKILFFPLSITIALAVSVFYIKPEIDIAQQNRTALAEKKVFAVEVEQKVKNVHDLESDLDTHKETETTVFRYLPITRYDDRIVDSINFLASQSGLALTSVKINEAANVVDLTAVVPEEASLGSAAIFAQGSDIAAVSQIQAVVAKPKALNVSVTAIGSYESIRDVIGKLSHTDRLQRFTSVTIDRLTVGAQSPTGESVDTSNILNASLSMDVMYFPKVKAKGSLNHPVLTSNAFDFSVAKKLTESMSTPIPTIEVGSTGTNNPFLR